MAAELFEDIYPCSCGHCTECGLNFVPTEREACEWAAEDGITGTLEELIKHYSGS